MPINLRMQGAVFSRILGIVCWLLVSGVGGLAFAQTFRVSGYVYEKGSEEGLELAKVYFDEGKKGVLSNADGSFSMKIPAGAVKITAAYQGYFPSTYQFNLKQDTSLVFILQPDPKALDTVLIEANGFREEVNSTQMGRIQLKVEEVNKLPVLFGEVDPLKTIQLLPGIQGGNEGTTGFFVRGGGTDQNLILFDGTPLYYPSHLMGLLSVFNGDALEDVTAYKGGFPAEYGGRLSSVVEIQQRQGNREKFGMQGGIGLLSSRLTLEGPLANKQGSYLISGRRTYFDLFTRGLNQLNEDNPAYQPIPDYQFWDLNGRIDYQLGENDQFFLSAYHGKDDLFLPLGFDLDTEYDLFWGNTGAGLTWKHVFSNKLFVETAVRHTAFRYKMQSYTEGFDLSLSSNIRDYSGTNDWVWAPNPKHTLRFGAGVTHHFFSPQGIVANADDFNFSYNSVQSLRSLEAGAYVSDDWKPHPRLGVHLGFRMSAYKFDTATYLNPEPRIALRYSLKDNISLKLAATRMNQYVHQVSNSSVGLPIDLWYPATDRTPPQTADQISGGWSGTFFGDKILITNEFFYKRLHRQVEYKEGIPLFLNTDFEEDFTVGRGWGYGGEWLIRKNTGKLTGWIAYTLSWSKRQFDWKNFGEPYFYRNDRRHDVAIVASYQLNPRLNFGATWVYGSGQAMTLPNGRFVYMDPTLWGVQDIVDYTERNGVRAPAYHRADVALTWELRPKRGESNLNFSIYNLYSRRNTFFLYMNKVRNEDKIVLYYEARKVTLFPILPSVTYNFKF